MSARVEKGGSYFLGSEHLMIMSGASHTSMGFQVNVDGCYNSSS